MATTSLNACAAPAPQDEGREAHQEEAKPGRISGTLKVPKRAQAAPVQGTLPVGVAIGQQVKVLASCTNPRLKKWVGKVGTVSSKTGSEAWDVIFKGKAGGLAGFHTTELEVVL